ncbi:hypothetical protein BJ742DRAFT_783447 [Cladochytrium replicatum]|nr:hypothetical protein BJ742DRAFT_783447 [Cladochytrium replicatum]
MPVVNVTVKWSGKKFDNIQLDTDLPPEVFKAQLYTLTGVEPERQKLMGKGGMIKDDSDLNKLNIKEGQVFTMLGSAGEIPIAKPPPQPVMFMEDMTDTQIAQALKLPAGMVNLGNTCYMNATVQCLRAIPELSVALHKWGNNLGGDPYSNLAVSLRTLFGSLETSGEAVPPLAFLQLLRTVHPQFAEQGRGGYAQQDAEECWGQIVTTLREKVPGLKLDGQINTEKRFIDQFMTLETTSTLTCDEAPAEDPTISIETSNKLQVTIGPGVSTYMVADIQSGLTQAIEKHSPSLNRTAKYTKKSQFSRLPAYLAVNFVRFQWKAEQRVRAKILKAVKFPMALDMRQYVTADLAEKLEPARQRIKAVDEASASIKKHKKKQKEAQETAGPSTTGTMDVDIPSRTPMSQLDFYRELNIDSTLAEDVGANVSGYYELIAVLTHVGRAADSGHYIGWVKQTKKESTSAIDPSNKYCWWKFDDDKVSMVADEDILKLEGGGDWHSAYICLYAAKPLEDIPAIPEP